MMNALLIKRRPKNGKLLPCATAAIGTAAWPNHADIHDSLNVLNVGHLERHLVTAVGARLPATNLLAPSTDMEQNDNKWPVACKWINLGARNRNGITCLRDNRRLIEWP